MSNFWRTKADVLKDLGSVNGRRTGVEHLDQHVVQGERPPPIPHETPDEDELRYFSGGQGCPAAGDTMGPDLAGISVMLKMVDSMDESGDHNESMTLYHNKATDEIRISKLNPCAGEYVPGRVNVTNGHTIIKENVPQRVNTPKKFNNMFKTRNDKKLNGRNVSTNVETSNSAKKSPDTNGNNVEPNDSLQSKPNLLANGFPKRTIDKSGATDMFSPKNTFFSTTSLSNNVEEIEEKIKFSPNKADEIKEIQEKIKSSIIASSNDNTLQTKRQKNVAIATLLKMGTVPQAADETPMKLIKPEYYENPPSKTELNVVNETPMNGTVEENVLPSTSSSETDLDYVDPDSISKVTGWFNNMESPKPKPEPQKPLVLNLEESVTFKKKSSSASSVSRTSEANKDKKEPIRKQKENNTPFKPSSYADELLKKYESNAKRSVSLGEDLGTMLERQLRERDEVIKQKMLARQNAG